MKYYKSKTAARKKTPTPSASGMLQEGIDLTLLQNSMTNKDNEIARLQKQLKDIELAKSAAVKEKEQFFIKSELSKVANKLKVKTDLMDDFVTLVTPKFVIKNEKLVPVEKPDADAESFVNEILQAKQSWVGSTVAQSAGTTPQSNSTLPVMKIDPSDPASLTAYARSLVNR
jgi:hypothetical protein